MMQQKSYSEGIVEFSSSPFSFDNGTGNTFGQMIAIIHKAIKNHELYMHKGEY